MGWMGWLAVAAGVCVAAFLWRTHFRYKNLGLGDGRSFGNQIADAIGVEHNLFHSVLDISAPGPSLIILNGMRQMGVTPMTAAMDLSPFLVEGVNALEARFGPQRQLEHARAVFTRLLMLANEEAERLERKR